MNPCACGCGRLVKNKWARGHQYRKGRGNQPVPGVDTLVQELQSDGPPPFPATVDRRRWRLASERPGTNPFQPWRETRCHNCALPMWTRDPTSTWEHGAVCEECEFILRTGMYEQQGKRASVQDRTFHDPFRPKA